MKVLVTGGGGFLGLNIVEQCVARGETVRTFSRGVYPELQRFGVEAIQGDLRDAEEVARACLGVDAVIHTAALAGVWGKWADYYSVNFLGTKNVIQGCHKHGVGRLVFTSSPSATFSGGEQNGIDESAPYGERLPACSFIPARLRWLAHYPRSKAMAEQLVLAADGEEGLSTCALRPHIIWGPRDPHMLPRLLDRARSGKLRRIGKGKNLIDITYVDNAARAHLQAADILAPNSPVSGKAYYLSQGEPVNCWEWIDSLLEMAGLPPVTRSIPLQAAASIGAICEAGYSLLRIKKEPPMTRFVAYQLGRSHYYDLAAAKTDLGYVPSISTEEGMERLAQSRDFP